ncbi:MAG TPA: WbqC family protein [Cytophagaceae bacterium]|nr:WbqC family protein [Cytophagaceae bacterium]
MSVLLLETQYLPSIPYFVEILSHDSLIIEAFEHYQKQTYRNRCRILTSNKINILSVPVINVHRKVLIREVEIDYSQKWLNMHWRGITSAYAKSPFFEYYADYFREVLFKKHRFLFDLNTELLTLCLKLLRVNKRIELSREYNNVSEKEDVIDLRNLINQDAKSEIISGIEYTQEFGRQFVPHLSIIDLLFCEGNNASKILILSKKN